MKKFYTISLIFLFSGFVLSTNGQDPGSLDPSFGVDGKITHDYQGQYEKNLCGIILSSGKILMGGQTESLGNTDMIICRLEANGAIDYSFGNNGYIIWDFEMYEAVTAFLELANNKILVAGYIQANNGMQTAVFARLKADGNLDQSFGTVGTGYVTTSTYISKVTQMYLQDQDSSVIIAGDFHHHVGGYTHANITKLFSEGTFDTDFGVGGFVEYAESPYSKFHGIDKLGNKYVAAGTIKVDTLPPKYNYFIGCINSDGEKDTGFGVDGTVIQPFYNIDDVCRSIIVQPDDKILCAGYSTFNETENDNDFTIIRLNSSGSLDMSFGYDGMQFFNFNDGSDKAKAMVLQADGKFILGGYSNQGSSIDYALVRADSNGDLDPEFGDDGIVFTDFSPHSDYISKLVFQQDAKLLAIGGSDMTESASGDFAVARYYTGLNAGIIDTDSEITDFSIYPNPVTEKEVNVKYTLLNASHINISLISIDGKLTCTLLNKDQQAGNHTDKLILPSNISDGYYLLEITANESSSSIKLHVN